MQRFISPERPMDRDIVTELGTKSNTRLLKVLVGKSGARSVLFYFVAGLGNKVQFLKGFSFLPRVKVYSLHNSSNFRSSLLNITQYNDIVNNISCNSEVFMKKFAFTLAEVLITLGIIGVVAALTIPALVGKYEIYLRQQQFKKAYSTLSTALQKADYELGGQAGCYYFAGELSSSSTTQCELLFDTVASTFKTVKKCDDHALDNGCLPDGGYKGGEIVYSEDKETDEEKEEAKEYFTNNCSGFSTEWINNRSIVYNMNDGLIIISYGGRANNTIRPAFAVDVNGKKGPNKWGHDVFTFQITKETLSSGLKLTPSNTTCNPVEKGGKNTLDYWVLMNKGVSRF